MGPTSLVHPWKMSRLSVKTKNRYVFLCSVCKLVVSTAFSLFFSFLWWRFVHPWASSSLCLSASSYFLFQFAQLHFLTSAHLFPTFSIPAETRGQRSWGDRHLTKWNICSFVAVILNKCQLNVTCDEPTVVFYSVLLFLTTSVRRALNLIIITLIHF